MRNVFIYIIFFLAIYGCKEKFVPSLQSPNTGYLVVEGYINNGTDPSIIKLTRTTKLYDTNTIIYEHNAVVTIEGENQEVYPLYESSNGTYTSGSINLNNNERYRLHIRTQDGREYLSDFESARVTPPIDSISWQRTNDGVEIYVNTHDSQIGTGYYKWDYEETWEFHSAYVSTLKYYIAQPYKIIGVGFRDPVFTKPDSTIYKCWQTINSTNINIGSSEKLTSDVIYLPIVKIPSSDEMLSVLYSIKVKQYAVSKNAYLFYQNMKSNTEQLGSIFDPLPTALQTNIHCTTNPSEVVVGYVNISQEQSQRIFISNTEVPGWNYSQACGLTLINNDNDLYKYAFGVPTTAKVISPFGSVLSFYASTESCVDCTTRGSNVKPNYWP